VSLASEVGINWQNWPKVGNADFNWLLFDVYQSELKVRSGQFQADKPLSKQALALVIQYERKISSADFADATIKQWQKIGYEQSFIEQWQGELPTLFPTVSDGDQLAMVSDGINRSVLLFKASSSERWQEIRRFEDSEFTERFLSIWLSARSQYPKLRQQLIGESR
jgi:hypothetical protein